MNTLLILFRAKQLLLSLLIVLNHDNPDYVVVSSNSRDVTMTVLTARAAESNKPLLILCRIDNFSERDFRYEVRRDLSRFQIDIRSGAERVALTEYGYRVLDPVMQPHFGDTQIRELKSHETNYFQGDLSKLFQVSEPGSYAIEVTYNFGTLSPAETDRFQLLADNIKVLVTKKDTR